MSCDEPQPSCSRGGDECGAGGGLSVDIESGAAAAARDACGSCGRQRAESDVDQYVAGSEIDGNCISAPVDTSGARQVAVGGGEIRATYWIECKCGQWFHTRCVGVEPFELIGIDEYHCSTCEKAHGPTIHHSMVCAHRYRFYDASEVEKSAQVGTRDWLLDFVENIEPNIAAPTADEVEVLDNGVDFHKRMAHATEWTKVFLVKSKEGLGMKMPSDGFNIHAVKELMGSDLYIDAIDVWAQDVVQMTLGRFAQEWSRPQSERRRPYNFLSLEFSNSRLSEIVHPPSWVQSASWADRLWPDDPKVAHDLGDYYRQHHKELYPSAVVDYAHLLAKPTVSRFCLAGMAGSYTDFHVDFGGSSVWYHIFRGRKVFYIARPSAENLRKYERHQALPLDERSVTFLGEDLGSEMKRVVINEGETLMIPSGWIHAVYTPVDSLVFGGNFLHDLSVLMQLKVYELEQRLSTENRYLYPQFELVNWYACASAVEQLAELNDESTLADERLWSNLMSWQRVLLNWTEAERNLTGSSKLSVLFAPQLAKLGRELKQQEKVRRQMTSAVSQDCDSPKPKKKKRSSNESSSASSPSRADAFSQKIVESPLKLRIPRTSALTIDSPFASPNEDAPKTSSVVTSAQFSPHFPKFSAPPIRSEPKQPKKEEEADDATESAVEMMFTSSRSSLGRARRPSQWVREMCGERIDEAVAAAAAVAATTAINDEFEEVLEDPEWKEEQAAPVELDSHTEEVKLMTLGSGGSSKQQPNHPGAPKSNQKKAKKPPVTAKQRLAAKLKLKF